jgi:hypothetical protein
MYPTSGAYVVASMLSREWYLLQGSIIATILWPFLVVTVYSSLTCLVRRPQGVVLLGGLVVVGRMHRVPEALDADYERCLLFTALSRYLLMQSLQRKGPLQTILLLWLWYTYK